MINPKNENNGPLITMPTIMIDVNSDRLKVIVLVRISRCSSLKNKCAYRVYANKPIKNTTNHSLTMAVES